MEKLDEKLEQKKQKIIELRNKFDLLINEFGVPIDEGIKGAVVYFNALGFKTHQSCAGHFREEGPRNGPYVEFFEPRMYEGPDDVSKEEKIKAYENIRRVLVRELNILLDEFYDGKMRNPEISLRVSVGHWTSVGSPKGSDMRITKEDFDVIKKEMDDFVQFLKEKYFSTDYVFNPKS